MSMGSFKCQNLATFPALSSMFSTSCFFGFDGETLLSGSHIKDTCDQCLNQSALEGSPQPERSWLACCSGGSPMRRRWAHVRLTCVCQCAVRLRGRCRATPLFFMLTCFFATPCPWSFCTKKNRQEVVVIVKQSDGSQSSEAHHLSIQRLLHHNHHD